MKNYLALSLKLLGGRPQSLLKEIRRRETGILLTSHLLGTLTATCDAIPVLAAEFGPLATGRICSIRIS